MRNLSKATIAYLILVIVITVMLIFSIVKLVSGDDSKKPTAKTKSPTTAKVTEPRKPNAPEQPAAKPPVTPTPPPTPPATTPVAPAGAAAKPLTNTGPGEVVLLFIATTLVGGYAHYRWLIAKQRVVYQSK